jgi:hypothetical protein
LVTSPSSLTLAISSDPVSMGQVEGLAIIVLVMIARHVYE